MSSLIRRLAAIRAALAPLAAAAFTACSSLSSVDVPLERWTPEVREESLQRIAGERAPDILVLVAFSGGGTRAAAFAYGLLEELAVTQIETAGGPRPLLAEIDVISSVSGGSFTSAYFGLRGERIFDEFEDRFLRKDIEAALFLQLLRPINWIRLGSATFGRSDLAAEYYAENIFDHAAFAELARPGAPFVAINATDLGTGVRFSFTSADFDLICADIDRYPISRAVAASSAVPGLLSPVTLESFAGSCGYEPPAWFEDALADPGLTRRKVEARVLDGYLDQQKRPWIHLVDGGIADNLGLRAFYSVVDLEGSPISAFRELQPDLREILMISVNAAAKPEPGWSLKRYAPSLAEVVNSVTSDQIDRYSFETIELVTGAYEKWARELSRPGHPVEFEFVEVAFDAVEDETERAFLNSIETNFDLDDEQVDALIGAARKVLRRSPEFKAFLERNGAATRPRPGR